MFGCIYSIYTYTLYIQIAVFRYRSSRVVVVTNPRTTFICCIVVNYSSKSFQVLTLKL